MDIALTISVFILGCCFSGSLSQLKVCTIPQSPANGLVNCVTDDENRKCYATCNSGYTFQSTSVEFRTCNLADGSWKTGNTFPDCVEIDKQTGTGSGSGPTFIGSKCIDQLTSCPGEGDYHACTSCSQYVTCASDGIFKRQCPGTTFWDDIKKRCVLVSSTCS